MPYTRPNGVDRFQDLSSNKQGLPSVEVDTEYNGIVEYMNGLAIITAPVDEWQLDLGIPTYTSPVTFTLAGDQTPTYMTGRKVKFSLTGPEVFSTVVDSSYSSGTITTTVTIEDAVLTANLDEVYYGLISAGDESSLPTNHISDDAVNYLHSDGSVLLDNDAGVVGSSTVLAPVNVAKVNALDVVELGDIDYAASIVSNKPPVWDNGTYESPLLFIGEIRMWSTDTFVPEGWLLCQGQEVGRVEYEDLFDVIGIEFGAGDLTTTFNLPDFRGRSPIGTGTGTAPDATLKTLAEAEGTETHVLDTTEMPAHTHSLTAFTGAGANVGGTGTFFGTATTSSTGGDLPHNNLSPYLAILFIIKA